MKMYEYMAKGVLAARGLPVPPGRLASTPPGAEAAARDLGPVAVKAQVLVGGRGKAGGIRLAETPADARQAAEAILGMDLKGYRVEQVYVEEKLAVDRELYLAIAVDNGAKRPVMIASAHGGVDIEEVPEKDILRLLLPVPWGLQPHAAREAARQIGLGGDFARQFVDIAMKVYEVFSATDAELVELNPLAVCGHRLVVADARLNVDDDALYRHSDLPRTTDAGPVEQEVHGLGLSYVHLDGDIAVMANGAGMAMATLDALQRFGGRPMNFLDAGGGAAAEPMARALEILVSTGPKAVLINIFGGITRCDDVARAILTARKKVELTMPLVVRLVGTNEERAVDMLAEHGIQAFRSMEEAAARAAELAGSARPA